MKQRQLATARRGQTVIVRAGGDSLLLDDSLKFVASNEDGSKEYIAEKDAVLVGTYPRERGGAVSIGHLDFARAAKKEFGKDEIAFEYPIEDLNFVNACEKIGLKAIRVPGGGCPIAYFDELIVRKSRNEYFIVGAERVDEVTKTAKDKKTA